MASFKWNGDRLKKRAIAASELGVDRTMGECVAEAKTGHPEFPPASNPGERYANRTGSLAGSIQMIAPAMFEGGKVNGSWGSLSNIALFLEIGTSRSGPDAMEREAAGGGNMWAIPAPDDTLMAARPTLRPTADIQYPLLRSRVAAAFQGREMP